MGGKQTWGRKHIFLCVAILTFLIPLGCNFKIVRVKDEDAMRRLESGRRLLAQGNYEGAFGQFQTVIVLSPQASPADEALFCTGLIYAYPGNPGKNDAKSASYFKKLIKDFPQSPFREPAKILIGMLQDDDRLNQTIEKLNQIIEESKKVDIQLEEKRKDTAK